jgi:tetratricopeptide (TPR) repeat protein
MDNMDKRSDELKDILSQQHHLKVVREKVAKLLDKRVFVISGDLEIRGAIKGYMETLGFSSKNIKATNNSTELISQVKQDPEKADLVICNLKALDSRYGSQTGFQLLRIISEMLSRCTQRRSIPFIFVEKEFTKEEIISSFKAGASQFLVFPSDPIAFGKKISDVFEGPKESTQAREVNSLLLEANKLRERGEFEQSIVLYNKALDVGGENAEVFTEKGNALLQMEDIEQAVLAFQRAIEIEMNFPRAYQGLGASYEQLGEVQKAKENFSMVLELEPDNVQVCYNLGVLYQEEANYDQAKFYFEKGIKKNKQFFKNYLGLAKNYEAQEKPQEALNVYKQAMSHNPSQTFLSVTAGDFCLKHDMNKEAEEIFCSAISANETNIHLYNRMGIALRKQKKYDEAITNFAKAIKVNPDDPNLRYNLAKAYYMKGEEQTAIDKLLKAFELDAGLKVKFEQDMYFSKLLEKYPGKFNL